jgi:hypothetical protein
MYGIAVFGFVVLPDFTDTHIKVMPSFTLLFIYWFEQISVYPREVQPENPNSYKVRKREYFRLQRERKKARKEGLVEPQLVLASSDDAPESTVVDC